MLWQNYKTSGSSRSPHTVAGRKGYGQNGEINECVRNLEQGCGNWEEASQTADEKAWLFTHQDLVSSTQELMSEIVQGKVAINLHDREKIHTISFQTFRARCCINFTNGSYLKCKHICPTFPSSADLNRNSSSPRVKK